MDLATTYLGLALEHPVVASASPLSDSVDGIKRLEDGGAAAVVMFSLFEEQIRQESAALSHLTEAGGESFAESLNYFPEAVEYRTGGESYLDLIRRGAEAVDIPIIASLNGVTDAGWTAYAKEMESAGAAALELNVYHISADLNETSREVEHRYLDILKSVKAAVSIPVSMKLSPFFSATGNMCRQLDESGVDGLVLFNRFYQPDLDLDKLVVSQTLELSTPAEIRLPLLWIAVLYGRVTCSLAATTGVHSEREVLKYLMAGASAVMSTSALLKNGPNYAHTLVNQLKNWMERKEYDSVAQLRGSMSQQNVADPAAFERANYIKILASYRNPFAI